MRRKDSWSMKGENRYASHHTFPAAPLSTVRTTAATEAVDSGSARGVLDQLIRITQDDAS